MVRSEIRLAKVEIREEAKRAVSSGVWIAAGAVGAMSAWIFLLWTMAYALATLMPMWAATLVVAVVDGRWRRGPDHGWHPEGEANSAHSGTDGGIGQGESRMDETANEIEAHIDRARERLGSN